MKAQIYVKPKPTWAPYFGNMNRCRFAVAILPLLIASSLFCQDCPEGQQPFALHIHTDAWGYELYWEMTPQYDDCGTNTLFWGGNALDVGCDGDGIDEAPEGYYDSYSTIVVDAICWTPEDSITLHHVDSYGDGGTYFEVFYAGVLQHSFQGTGTGNTWIFDPFAAEGPTYDSPCGAAAIEVNGPVVVVSNDSCTAAFGEPGAPNFDGVYSCQINGGWCESGVTGSAWLTFTAEEGNCWITACTEETDFDTQIALWKAEDCNDFSTYALVAANDDLPGGCGPGNGYASGMWSGCLEEGETYLIQIDGWQDSRGQAGILIESVEDGPQVTSATGGLDCALGKEEEPDGTIVLNISGTGGNYTTAWVGPNGYTSSGQQISNLSSGAYSAAIITSCGNTLTHSVVLNEPDPLVLDLEVVQPGCPELPNGEAYLGVTGGSEPYEIVWSNALGALGTGQLLEGLLQGAYAVEIEDDNGCSSNLSFTLEAQDDAFAFSLGPDTTICEGDQLVLSAPSGLSYIWSDGSNNQFLVINGADLGPGTYPVTVQASNEFGCSHADAIFITVFDCTTGIGGFMDAAGGPHVYPNPARDGESWTIHWPPSLRGGAHPWTLRDTRGRVLQSGVCRGGGAPLMVSTFGLSAGQYIIEMKEEGWALRLVKK